MPVDGSEDQESSALTCPASAALTRAGTEEDGGSAVYSQGSEASAACPSTSEAGEGNNGERCSNNTNMLQHY